MDRTTCLSRSAAAGSTLAKTTDGSWLLCKAGQWTCALPLDSIVEIMRMLPIKSIANAPTSVLGISSVRGAPVPVVSLQALLASSGPPPRRMVTARIGARIVAIAVETVLGLRSFGAEESGLPPLLREAAGEAITAIGALDSGLLLFLSSARVASPELLDQVSVAGALR